VKNSTDVPVNIALKQVGVLHWKNGVQPGETVTFNVGKVWFTVEAFVDVAWYPKSRYSEFHRTMPIVLASGGVLVLAGGAVGAGIAIAAVAGGVAIGTASAAAIAGTTGTAGAITVAEGAAIGAGATVVAGSTAALAKKVLEASAVAAGAAIAATTASRATNMAFDAWQKKLVKAEEIEKYLPGKGSMHGVYAGWNPRLCVKFHPEPSTLYIEDLQEGKDVGQIDDKDED